MPEQPAPTPAEAIGAADAPAAPVAAAPPILEMRGISKSFFGVPVLSEVDLDVRKGEVHAVLGENGAGKSTLMKILAGAHQPDAGTIILDGEEVRFGHPVEAQQAGVSIIYQEFNLLPERTVAQNIYLGREPHRGPFVDAAAMHRATRELLATLNVEGIRPGSIVRSLSVAQQQTVEIAKALSFRSKVLVMDEPTAALSRHEVESLFDRVRLLRERGVAIVYISHRLTEIFEIAQRVTVLKDGRRMGTLDVAATSSRELVRLMVGRELDHYFPPHATAGEIGDERLTVRGGGVTGVLHDIDVAVRRGEIVGIGGLAGSGRTELAQALFGVRPFDTGTIELDGKPIRVRSPRQAVRRRMGFVTEDRKLEGLVLPLSVRANSLLALRSLGSWIRRGKGAIEISELLRTLDLRGAGLDQEVRFLSGGNQQKVVLAKWLASEAQVLIFDEPTRGIDVGAKAGIHELMRELARNGAAILMISSELPELIGMSDRIVVLRNGSIAGELAAGPTEADIMFLATGEQDTAGAA
ncbi:MAG TPA: sugar ABC transporter ATP-binding protein [Candidatus Limnocylindrales bacterium]|nr:sugar ABC transporter ATP-binding protein [Candidatus Limnocylindrales bacterium]